MILSGQWQEMTKQITETLPELPKTGTSLWLGFFAAGIAVLALAFYLKKRDSMHNGKDD